MKIVIPKETTPEETRVPMVPEAATPLCSGGADLYCEAGIGEAIHVKDAAYEKAGVRMFERRRETLQNADFTLMLNPLPDEDFHHLKEGSIVLGYLHPFVRQDPLDILRKRNVSALSMELVPRSTIAQKMDAISSQANLAGYAAVLHAAERIDKIFPMMMTPAGTIKPARVFIIGAGVAGLQAIATAKRLGARVEAFDTRPVVAEQVESLGAKFLKVDLGETGQDKSGYAKQLTEEQLALQREAMAKACAQADVVITTAQLFGRPAPTLVTREMVEGMMPGSYIVDLAASTGGNVEGVDVDQEVEIHGVRIFGASNFPGFFPNNASAMYASNLRHFIQHFWDKETSTFTLKLDDEIIQSCLVTHNGEFVNEFLKQRLSGEST